MEVRGDCEATEHKLILRQCVLLLPCRPDNTLLKCSRQAASQCCPTHRIFTDMKRQTLLRFEKYFGPLDSRCGSDVTHLSLRDDQKFDAVRQHISMEDAVRPANHLYFFYEESQNIFLHVIIIYMKAIWRRFHGRFV